MGSASGQSDGKHSPREAFSTTNTAQQEYQLGFAMSGAVSAGAYTAGVLDFFIQALEEWEQHRHDPDVPNHRVGIKAIAGASAGAITGALSVISLAYEQKPEPAPSPKEKEQRYKCFLPSLYDTWVVRPSMLPEEKGWPGFLTTEDFDDLDKDKKGIVSLLNSVLLDRIKNAALQPAGQQVKRPYICDKLHIYMTVTNLRGIPYSIDFKGGSYSMMLHGDRVHYEVTGLGTWVSRSKFGADDLPRPIDVGSLFQPAEPDADSEWQRYALCALASGAFPLGLSARGVAATIHEYGSRKFPMQDAYDFPDKLTPKWPTGWKEKNGYDFVAVDGGVINNDPVEYARFTLMESPPTPQFPGQERRGQVGRYDHALS